MFADHVIVVSVGKYWSSLTRQRHLNTPSATVFKRLFHRPTYTLHIVLCQFDFTKKEKKEKKTRRSVFCVFFFDVSLHFGNITWFYKRISSIIFVNIIILSVIRD